MSSTKRTLKKEYIPIIIAVLVLIVMLLALIIVIFYKDSKGLIVPDLPDVEKVHIQIADIDNGKFDDQSLSSAETTNVKVEYNVVSDYYNQGIILANPRIELVDNNIVVSSQNKLDAPYISLIGTDSKLKWLNKIEYSKYDYFSIDDIVYDDSYFYAIATGEKDSKNEVIALKFNKDTGKEEKRVVIKEKFINKVSAVKMVKGGIAVVTSGSDNIIVYYLNSDLTLNSNPYELEKQKINKFYSAKPDVNGVSCKDETLVISLSYYLDMKGSSYLLNINLDKNTATLNSFNGLNSLDKSFKGYIKGFKDTLYTVRNKVIYSYNIFGKLASSYDYNNMTLEKLSQYKDYYDADGNKISDVENFENSYSIIDFYFNNDKVIVKGETLFNYVYDIFDKDLKIEKRYLINQFNYDYDQGILLKTFYIDGKLYEVYTYGNETASIMISVIG